MSTSRKTIRFAKRLTRRSLNRTLTRTRWQSPDYLGEALIAFRHAIRAHQRLGKLAPRFFDSVEVNNDRIRYEQDRSWMAKWEPILDKVYGTKPESLPPLPPTPPLPHPNTQRAIKRHLAAWDAWMAAGRVAMDRYRRRRPHDLMPLTRLARLMQIAHDFAVLACGYDPKRPPPEPHDEAAVMAAIERAYPSSKPV